MTLLLLQSAPYFLYICFSIQAFFFALTRLHVYLPIERKDLVAGFLPGVQIVFPLVILFALITAISGVLGLLSLTINENARMYSDIHKVLKAAVEFGLRISSLYLLDSRVIPQLASYVPVTPAVMRVHSRLVLLFSTLTYAFTLTSIFDKTPIIIPIVLGVIASSYNIPVILYIAHKQSMFRFRGWMFVIFLQVCGCISAGLAAGKSSAFIVLHTVVFGVWMTGTMGLFQTFCIPLGMVEDSSYRNTSPVPMENLRARSDPFIMSPRTTLSFWSEQGSSGGCHSTPTLISTSPTSHKKRRTSSFPAFITTSTRSNWKEKEKIEYEDSDLSVRPVTNPQRQKSKWTYPESMFSPFGLSNRENHSSSGETHVAQTISRRSSINSTLTQPSCCDGTDGHDAYRQITPPPEHLWYGQRRSRTTNNAGVFLYSECSQPAQNVHQESTTEGIEMREVALS